MAGDPNQANSTQDTTTSGSTQNTNAVDAPSAPAENAPNSDQAQGATYTQTVLRQPGPSEAEDVAAAFKGSSEGK
jgi:hypothetical protein